jgi:hypothetical protein
MTESTLFVLKYWCLIRRGDYFCCSNIANEFAERWSSWTTTPAKRRVHTAILEYEWITITHGSRPVFTGSPSLNKRYKLLYIFFLFMFTLPKTWSEPKRNKNKTKQNKTGLQAAMSFGLTSMIIHTTAVSIFWRVGDWMVARRKTETVPVKFEMVTLLWPWRNRSNRDWGKGKRNWDQSLKEQVLTTLELCTACSDSSILVVCTIVIPTALALCVGYFSFSLSIWPQLWLKNPTSNVNLQSKKSKLDRLARSNRQETKQENPSAYEATKPRLMTRV